MRLDKFLANASVGTRSEVKKIIRSGRITINGEVVKRPDNAVTADDQIALDAQVIRYQEYEYYMLNKPAGAVSATVDPAFPTVIDLIKDTNHKDLFPVGRLDKDTEGLLLITNDGAFAHNLVSPAKHVPKTYFVRVDGIVDNQDIALFEKGVDIGDKQPTKPAILSDIKSSKETGQSELLITITEGRYHQIKRMFQAIQKPVLYLKRIKMGALELDRSLGLGEYRQLSVKELESLKKHAKGQTDLSVDNESMGLQE